MGDVSSFTRTNLCDFESAEVDLRKSVRKRICVYVESAKDLRKGTHAHLCVIRCVRLYPHACAYVFIHQQLIWERCRHDV